MLSKIASEALWRVECVGKLWMANSEHTKKTSATVSRCFIVIVAYSILRALLVSLLPVRDWSGGHSFRTAAIRFELCALDISVTVLLHSGLIEILSRIHSCVYEIRFYSSNCIYWMCHFLCVYSISIMLMANWYKCDFFPSFASAVLHHM